MDGLPPERIDSTFRNGSLTAVSVVVGFSLSFLSRWAASPGEWKELDLLAVVAIVVGIACQLVTLRRLLYTSSLVLAVYERSVRVFMVGTLFVAIGVALAIVGDMVGIGQNVL